MKNGGVPAWQKKEKRMTDSREMATQGHLEGGGGSELAPSASRAIGIPMDQRMAMLREALTNPDVDPAKATAMADLLWKIEDREREAEFNRAKIKAIREMPAIYKRGTNDHLKTKFAKFEDLHRAAMPVLSRNGLTIDFRIGSEGRDITVQPILRHENGYIEEGGIMRGPPDEGKGRSNIMAVGSASSYLKRYAMKAMLNIIEDGEDDDGVGGRPDDQMNDRQERLVLDAQAAADGGTYGEWYGRQAAKDKAWLVTTGTHARLGGGHVLIGSTPRDERPASPPPPPPPSPPPPSPPPPPPTQRGKHDVATPEGWTAQYEDDCAAARDRDALQTVQSKGSRGMERLKASHPPLYERAVQAGADAIARLAAGGGEDLFQGGQDG